MILAVLGPTHYSMRVNAARCHSPPCRARPCPLPSINIYAVHSPPMSNAKILSLYNSYNLIYYYITNLKQYIIVKTI